MSLVWPAWTLPVLLTGVGLRMPGAQVPDSATLRRGAERAQVVFERTRPAFLPTVLGHRGGPCDEQIGRFCYWHEDSPDPPPAESRRITEARDTLIAALAAAAAALPGDPWIAGQQVRYLIEAGRLGEALEAARACRALPWWCEALAGLTLHAAGAFPSADSVYQQAARDMPAEVRCEWGDVAPLLERALRRRYERLPCPDRAAFETRLWWLAQPLYSRPGNDRRTEHWARVTMTHLVEHASTPYAVRWGDDLRELTLRYGWPVYWTQEPPRVGDLGAPGVTGHDAAPGWRFVPASRTFLVPESSGADDWALARSFPRERYAPSWATSLSALDAAISRFRRGDTSVVVAAYDLRRDPHFMLAHLDAALVLARDEATAPVIVERRGGSPAGVLVARAIWEPRLVSVEVTATAHHRLARARAGVLPMPRPERGVSGSDLLLFDPPDSLPQTFVTVLPYVRGPSAVRSDSRLGLFWELYGLPATGEAVTTTVTVTPAGGGWLRRLSEGVGLARHRTPLHLEWQEVVTPVGGVAARALALELQHLSPGRYQIGVAVRPPGQEPATSVREIDVVAR